MQISNWTIGFVCALGVTTTYAANVPSEDQLGEVYGQMLLVKAQAKLEEARQNLASMAGGMGDSGALPNVRKIDKINDDPATAELIFAGNVKVEAREGTKLPGGYRVEKIDIKARTVDIARGRDRYTVGMSSIVPQSPAKNGQQAGQGASPGFPAPYVPSLAR